MQKLYILEMVGSNVYLFLAYSGIVILVYFLLPQRGRTMGLLCCSALFYAFCDARFLALLLAEVYVSWRIGSRIDAGSSDRKRWLVIGILAVLLVLAFFKYYDFFLSAFSFSGKEIVLPMGISYYSFRILSYMADIFQGKRRSEDSFVCYAAYVMFFPQLLSGPIVRSESMLDALHAARGLCSADIDAGVRMIVSGLFKKVVIADRIGPYATTVFASPESYPALAAWMGAILYSIQLYCDFAGYSEIAIGISRCMGFHCPYNFLRPYLSLDMKEFWRRWHVSLSSWLRDYIYIPCGGSRTGKKWKVKRNVLLTFAACGLWHGSGIKYLVWGLYHGFWNMIVPSRRSKGILKKRVSRLATFLIAMFGWILFKAENFSAAIQFAERMFSGFSLSMSSIQAAVMPFTGDNSCAAYAAAAGILLLLLLVMEIYDEKHQISAEQYSNFRVGALFLLILLFGITGTGSFLYSNY